MSEVKVVLRLENGQYVADLKATGAEHQAFSAQVASSSSTASTSLGKVTSELQAVGAASTNATAAAAALDQASQAATTAGAAVSAIPRQLQGVAAQFTSAQGSLAGVSRQAGVTQASLTGATTAAQGLGTTLQTTGTQATRAGDTTVAATDRMRDAMRRAEQASRSAGVSAAQTAAALRNVPAQITDIVVSLQAGMNPMTVALQQGGQLKDMFGGIVPAARALSASLMGMVNPYTLAAAGAATLAAGYYQGSKEADNYRQAIVMSGNAAGTTVGQMADMARAIATTTGTQSAAAGALAEMVSMGRVSGDNLQYFTEVALGLEKYAGVPIKNTVGALEELGKAPLQASLKLNEQYRYLTESVYAQIKALDEQGRKEDAAALAQKTFASAMESRKNELVANLGSIERGWLAVTGAAKKGWDAILNVGRAETTQQKLDEVGAKIAAIRKVQASGGFETNAGGAATGGGSAGNKAREKQLEVLVAEQAALQESARLEKRGAEAKAETNRQMEARADWDKIVASNRTKEQQQEAEVIRIRNAGVQAGLKELDIQKQIDAYKARTADKGAGAGTASAALAREIGELEQLQAEATGISARAIAQLEAQHKAGLVSEAAYYVQKRDLALQANADQQAIVELELEAVESSKGSAAEKARARAQYGKELATLVGQELTIQSTYEDQVLELEARMAAQRIELRQKESAGIEQWMAEQQAAQRENLASIEERIISLADEEKAADLAAAKNISLAEAIELVTIARLEEQRNTKFYEGSDGWNQATQEIEARRRLAAQIGSRETKDAARKAGDEAKKELDRAADHYTQGLVNAAMQGGESLERYITDTLKRRAFEIVLQPVMSGLGGLMATVMGAGGGGGGVGGGAGGGGLSNLVSLGSNAYQFSQGTGMLYNAYGAASAYMGIGNSAAAAYLSHPLAGIATNGTVSGLATSSAGSTLGGGAGAGAAGGSWAAGGIAALIALAVINAVGGMRSETMIGSGLAGKLGGKDKLTPWEEWREGGTLVSGPEFSTGNPLEVLAEQKRRLQVERDEGRGETNYAVSLQATVTSLEESTKGLATQTEVFDREIQKGYKAYRANVVQMADSLGLGTDAIKDWVYELGAQDLNLMGLKPEEVQAKIAETFGKAGTDMAEMLIGTVKEVTDTVIDTRVDTTDPQNPVYTTETTVTKRMEYQASVYAKAGETAIQTLERLSTSFGALNNASSALGFGIHQGSLAVAAFADNFIEQFGGLERLTNSTNTFFQNFYTDEEQRQELARRGEREAERLGLKGVTAEGILQLAATGNKEAVKDAVNSLKDNPALYADAMDLVNGLIPLFNSAPTPAATTSTVSDGQREAEAEAKRIADQRKSLQDQLDELTMTRIELLEKERNAIDASNRSLWDQVQAAQTRKAIQDEMPALLDKYRTPEQRTAAQYDTISADLAAAGINVTGEQLAAGAKQGIAEFAMAISALGTTSDETRLAVMRAASSLADLKQAAVDSASAAADAALNYLGRAIEAQKEAISSAANTRIKSLQKEAEAQKQAEQAATEALSSVAQITESLTRAVRNLRGQVESTTLQDLAQARRFVQDSVAAALATGALPDAEELNQAIASVTSDNKQRYASAVDWEIAQLDQANQLAQLEQLGARQKTVAEQHLQATQDQARLLEEEITTIQEGAEKSLKALDEQLKAAQEQLELAKGMDASLKNIDAATANFAAALAALASANAASSYRPGGATTAPGGTPQPNAPRVVLDGPNGAQYDSSSGIFYAGSTGLPYQASALGAAAVDMVNAGQAKDLYDIAQANGITAAMLAEWTGSSATSINDWAKANGLPSFDVGTNYVPHDMLALIHEGERIVPKKYNPDASPGMWTGAQAISARLQRSGERAGGEAAVSSVITTLGRSVEQLGEGIGSLKDAALQTRDAARRTRDVMEAAARGELKLSVTTS
ncbi:phage tail length tape measure family protein [Acidovorax sp.]|uniref:phage tail length tape measure family protein n=1 Tax=Acidovorax sp. TaxID=1872122 RepID=UPI002ACE54B9|nr:phage tail length tape measure family protein [Acidovorax sp.]MDZ7862459.1 phage tail length tape measure family protein [Acidovorax sp.]